MDNKSGNRILIFGGSGFLGNALIAECLNVEYEVSVFDRKNVDDKFLGSVHMIIGDILDDSKVNEAVKNSDIVYNLAAMADIGECIEKPLEAIKYNILGNSIIMEACKNNGIKRFVYASSLYAQGNSGGIYSSTKKASEHLVKEFQNQYGLDYTILQYGTLYGKGDSAKNSMYRYLKDAATTGIIKYPGDGSETREYIHLSDAAKLSLKILNDEYRNKTVIITGGNPIKVCDLFSMIVEIMGGNIKIEYLSEVSKSKRQSHYKVTPYSYYEDIPQKLINNPCVDLGRGIIQVLDFIKKEK